MIIFRVTTGRSFTKFPTPKDDALSKPLRFAHRTAESSFLQSSLNPELAQSRDLDIELGLNPSISEPSTRSYASTLRLTQEKRIESGEVEKVV
jgi:hypothetical protein